jgi:UDP-N-acetylglucosamine 4,6-dehydratase
MKVLITGGTGSWGQAMTRRLLDDKLAQRIVIYSRGEHLQEDMARKFGNDDRMRFFIGDVRDQSRLEMAMHGIDTVFHAAAMKIVPTAEYNPYECVLTNIHGAENVCRASLSSGVQRVIALSTDKAVSPLNLYGATKLAAEKIFVAANNVSAGRCIYSVARYGNVVGSRGSVVPLFQRLAASAADLPITDPRMTRFWMTLDEAVDFVLTSMNMMKGREIFVPKIPSIKITDLAMAMAPEAKHEIVGIRPGEKLHETLMTEEEARGALEAWDRYIVNGDAVTNIAAPEAYSSNTNTNFLTLEQIRDRL